MDILKGTSIGAIICINDSLLRVAKNIKLFEPNMDDAIALAHQHFLYQPFLAELIFNLLGRYVLTVRRDDQVLFAPGPSSKGKYSENSSIRYAAAELI